VCRSRSAADNAARGFFVRLRQNCEAQTIEWVVHGAVRRTAEGLCQPFSLAEKKVKTDLDTLARAIAETDESSARFERWNVLSQGYVPLLPLAAAFHEG